ncbi:hypothetical protein CUU66_06295 [Peribacillus deserti]|uniref:Uncharacterized protein n=1 Tax=Peribacillus deserti TaxID=673318 RepID=A0A2N5M8T0_9BACI|nr:hypothetical protein CUU66_06295 [Peribacillus deserti]
MKRVNGKCGGDLQIQKHPINYELDFFEIKENTSRNHVSSINNNINSGRLCSGVKMRGVLNAAGRLFLEGKIIIISLFLLSLF